jgi:hypothetical protein
VHGSFYFKLSDYVDPSSQSGEKFAPPKDAKKAPKAPNPTSGPDREFEREPTMLKRIYLELFLEDKLIYIDSGRNRSA